MKFSAIRTINILFYIALLLPSAALCQTNAGVNTNGTNSSAIQTAVPFLLISPDSRSGALGDAGVALSPDANANFWNPSKLAFIEGTDNVSATYSPWLRNLVPDVSLAYLGYAHKLDDRNTLGASLRYFNLGSINFIDDQQVPGGTYIPNEFSLDVSLARKFGDNLSLGLTARYIHSALSSSPSSNEQVKAGNAVAADVSLYYKTTDLQEFGNDAQFSFGTNISNIGTKISYSDNGQKYFLPTNWKIGAANTINADDYNQFTLTVDFNKLLVPLHIITDENGNTFETTDDDKSVPAGIFSSFSSPGGLHEELQEVSISSGFEYMYNKLFALRVGYFYQNPNKGGLHYITLGTGLHYNNFAFDFSYIAARQQESPLANTLRFTLSASFGGTQ